MDVQQFVPKKWRVAASAALFSLAIQTVVPVAAVAQTDNSKNTRTPIKHVIVILGENRTFDHIFCDLQTEEGRNGKESAFRRHCECGWNAWPEFLRG